MVATKDDATHLHLAAQFKRHTIARRYLALVHGLIAPDTGTIDRPIGRHPTERKRMSSQARSGRRAVTHWQVLRRFEQERLTLVELRLETGRTHQIRVHLSEQHWPIVGDPVYGHGSRGQALADGQLRQLVKQLSRQALHARLLGFEHPASGRYLEWTSPLPADFQAILDYLEHKYRPAGG
jgi:23S rRNA pseudouridine1911/1915/1917 synthase